MADSKIRAGIYTNIPRNKRGSKKGRIEFYLGIAELRGDKWNTVIGVYQCTHNDWARARAAERRNVNHRHRRWDRRKCRFRAHAPAREFSFEAKLPIKSQSQLTKMRAAAPSLLHQSNAGAERRATRRGGAEGGRGNNERNENSLFSNDFRLFVSLSFSPRYVYNLSRKINQRNLIEYTRTRARRGNGVWQKNRKIEM